MTDDGIITNKMLLDHMQGRFDLIDRRFEKIDERFDRIDRRFEKLEKYVSDGFTEARAHREALQEDLEAVILKQGMHDRKLAVLTGETISGEFD